MGFQLGRLLIMLGLLLVGVGVVVLLAGRYNLPFGRLPGDIVYRGKNSTVYFPWVTCLLISALGTLILWLLNRR
ncbi:MAG: DUF2905 domain-containing protein [Acidobacteriaceae bacterium]|nr:DUF2905 domain-containing protein [Acidobacteriaceae bacterium]MBV8572051.1 DUF2905 domain-containing protein [Acidobacteriaceae bacterium]